MVKIATCIKDPESLNNLLSIVGTAESSSEHPLGDAVVKYVKKFFGVRDLGKCVQFEAKPGYGLQATVNGLLNAHADQACLNELRSQLLIGLNSRFESGLTNHLSKKFFYYSSMLFLNF